MKVPDKRGRLINIQTASIGKLKAMLTYYEGVVYRSNKEKANDKEFLISMLPEYYGVIEDELSRRGSTNHNRFAFLNTLKQNL